MKKTTKEQLNQTTKEQLNQTVNIQKVRKTPDRIDDQFITDLLDWYDAVRLNSYATDDLYSECLEAIGQKKEGGLDFSPALLIKLVKGLKSLESSIMAFRSFVTESGHKGKFVEGFLRRISTMEERKTATWDFIHSVDVD